MKVASDPVLSDVVRERLELLLAEVRPRYALPEADPADDRPSGHRDRDRPGLEPDSAGPPDRTPADVATDSRAGPPRPRERARPGSSATEAQGAAVGEPGSALRTMGVLAAGVGQKALSFTREHLAAVVLVLVVGTGWTVYGLLQARSTPVAVAAVPTVVASPTPTPSATPPEVLVHVLGAVRRPGLVRLPQGSRVADAIDAAGGLTGSAEPGELNLAAVVPDGAQVVVGTRSKPGGEVRAAVGDGGGGTATGSGTVSLNTATLQQLDTLPGVGPVTAQKILDWRAEHGRFTAVTELQEVDGIGPKTYADIAPHVRVP